LRVGDEEGVSAELVMNLTREVGFGREVKRRIILGTYALSSGYYDAYYGSAQKVRTLIIQDFNKAFVSTDVLVSPTAPTTAFKIGDKVDDPLAMYLNDIATIPVNMAGICLQGWHQRMACPLVSRSWLQRCRIRGCTQLAQPLRRSY
jgi:aspartyl-tRNA(Asn)/glutamyl-tRNA(Gln) amidotransferase subunit A